MVALGIVFSACASDNVDKKQSQASYAQKGAFYAFGSSIIAHKTFLLWPLAAKTSLAVCAPLIAVSVMGVASAYYGYKFMRPVIPVQSFNPRDWWKSRK